jgi:P-type Ca2+ transporter type 2C
MFIIFLATLNKPVDGKLRDANAKGQDFINVFILAISIVVVAIPEGLPLAVTLALAFATKRMTKDNNLVRHLQSCETMGNATVICSDKTGTLTQNEMTVVAGAFGKGTFRAGDGPKFQSPPRREDTDDTIESPSTMADSTATTVMASSGTLDESAAVPMYDLPTRLSQDFRLLLKDSIVCNTTAFENEQDEKMVFTGSKTETALLYFAQRFLGMGSLGAERDDSRISQLYPFDSRKKCMGVVVSTDSGKYRLYIKGAPEIVLTKCNWVLKDPTTSTEKVSMADDDRRNLRKIISMYASLSLRTIALAYKDFDTWPLPGQTADVDFDAVFGNLVWTTVVGIQDPVRDGVPQAVKDCERAGVKVVMVTGDNVETARAIAKDCGILKEGGEVIEGPQFRRLSETELDKLLPKLCVIARSSPEDKKTLVKAFKARGDVVAVTGDGTNDAPALKAADVGFSMGISGTEVAKEASDIILMDDNFSSTVKALAWGRTVNDAVKKFLQFQLTVNITAVLLTFVSAVASAFLSANKGEEKSVINAVQLLWVNLIMDTFAALALATDSPSRSMLDRKPESRTAPLITVTMWKMIWVQAILQMFVSFFLYFAGPSLPHIGDWDQTERNTLIFNTFVWMQIFNAVNCRRIDNKLNIFESFWNNWIFIGILFVMVGGQVLIVFIGGAAFSVVRIDGVGWAISIIIGFLSLPVGVIARYIPDAVMAAIMTTVMRWVPKMPRFRRKKPDVENRAETMTHDIEFGGQAWDQDDWREALKERIDDELRPYRQGRGRRLGVLMQGLRHPNQLPAILTNQSPHRSANRSRAGSRHSVLTAVVAPAAMTASAIRGGSSHSSHNSTHSIPIVPSGAATPTSPAEKS